ncbi:DUF4202 family protein [Candidatus Pacearchaeota archaeon]|nr:DUF4202 family protein [Candidatus Pacearchaeota archaeon]
MSELYDKVERFVEVSYSGKFGMVHFKRTVYWVKQLKPDADEAMLIAAIAHDIERAFREEGSKQMQRIKSSGMKDEDFLKYHQEKGAEIIEEFLIKNNANLKLVERVKTLISKHEVGGSDDENILKDADSISFFENNVDHFLTEYVSKLGKEKIKEKFDWMFNRITSNNAKKIAKPWYNNGINNLNKLH